jgi:DNA polymerase/3'-5' exonuclease PolX
MSATESGLAIKGDKPRFPRAAAISAARDVVSFIEPFCERIIVDGSLRRRKTTVGDIEILYIPRFTTEPDGLFDKKQVNQVDRALESLIATGLLAKRTNVIGSESWGPKNKYARHCRAGIPLDLFEATESNWFNYLVCRTGSAGNNTLIASAAIKKGWKWHPYASGFTDNSGRLVQVHSEKDVFTHVGLPYREPWER